MADYAAHTADIREIKVLFGEPQDRRQTFLGLNQRSVQKEIFKKRLSCEVYLANEETNDGFCKYDNINVSSKRGEKFVNEMSS